MANIHYVNPRGSMEQLSHFEVEMLTKQAKSALYQLYRNCSLAVLNSGAVTDDSRKLLSQYPDFDIELVATERGITLKLYNPPESAFVDQHIIRNIQYHLFAVLRDIVFVNVLNQRINPCHKQDSDSITNQVFSILRNAKALIVGELPNLVVCWGGHSINQTEYQYCRAVGLELGYRELNIVTGCGPGVMEAPMKGAAIGHANQRYKQSRFIGITEPSIIASEPPNPIVNELIIMPDIEKRLEAFVRMGHGIVIFPGGPGTFEELLYILGIKLNPANQAQLLPLILTGPKESADYFATIDRFIGKTLGEEAQSLYQIIIDDPAAVARHMKSAMEKIRQSRYENNEAYGFNWSLKIDPEFQTPFIPTHENMANLDLHMNQSKVSLAANLRRVFSGIVAGNIKPDTQDRIAELGKFQLKGDKALMEKVDNVLQDFITQHRMKLPDGEAYEPCYEIIR
ncbi:nucleotide 5'-monophosphate nucleosidase PpnN [Avibacterium paragallinarum]|uniref:nucleotide 5'-monophosphate nucleosidase PpnN n=1 Tax=Avibacterium paragallinarum TaxID=728 RepID=UPI0002DDEDE7|nr:nucleotide 5'-monophosphate nucleosidase PpnN [Avibacterium paragallinarum]AZI14236.1 LOG family protein [Avibacterium paragallinarum]QIR11708.1 LOG family protein [Avibacterium paragallinarum]QJE09317.1 LOG family protein [Avibacterium paragallinarum]QJE11513.1 LOG family protein [Avibacterium paragallinarum]QJE13713.1 LOG family protein [Avibacterium paragallinarum]